MILNQPAMAIIFTVYPYCLFYIFISLDQFCFKFVYAAIIIFIIFTVIAIIIIILLIVSNNVEH